MIDCDEPVNEFELLRCFNRPETGKRSKVWVNHFSDMLGSQPFKLENGRQYSPSMVDMRSGQGLVLIKGWHRKMIAFLVVSGVIMSLLISLVWTIKRDLVEGFTIGSYVLAAEAVSMAFFSALSALE
jgi:hypothetical protein